MVSPMSSGAELSKNEALSPGAPGRLHLLSNLLGWSRLRLRGKLLEQN